MPKIPPPDRTPNTKLTLTLRADIVDNLRSYAEFLGGADPGYIVSVALKPYFADKDFVAWLEAQSATKTSDQNRDKTKKGTAVSSASAA